MNAFKLSRLMQAMLLASVTLAAPQMVHALPLATGQTITPLAPTGAVQQLLNPGLAAYPTFVAGGAVRSQLSPDGTILAVLTAGQNTLYKADGSADVAASTQFIFLYTIAGENRTKPALIQVIQQVNAHVGLVWSPDGSTIYAAGGNDDAVYAYTKTGATWAQSAKIALNHYAPGATGAARNKGVGLSVQPNAGGLAISADGKTLVVANNYNDSISVIDTATKTVRYEHDLRPFFANNEKAEGVAGGTYPFAVVMKGNGMAYISANRDREIVVIDVSDLKAGKLVKRIKLEGNPLGMTLDKTQNMLYVAQDNTDQVAGISTATNEVLGAVDTRAPAGMLSAEKYKGADRVKGAKKRNSPPYTGASPIAVTISPDGKTLYVVNDGANSVAVIPLVGDSAYQVAGLIPTGYAPKDITFSPDGKSMYIINGKSQTGPNPGHLHGSTGRMTSASYKDGKILTAAGNAIGPVPSACNYVTPDATTGLPAKPKCQLDNEAANTAGRASNQYQFQLEQAGLVSAPVPSMSELEELTHQVAQNNFYNSDQNGPDAKVMAFLNSKIKHIIYVVKENRTFDQVLGDLNNGSNGDSNLTVFGKAITPNHHALAKNFVTIDNFMDPGDGSMDGWSWSMAGRVTSTEAITQQINYAGVNRGLSYESEGANRNVPVNFPTVAERDAVAGVAGANAYTTAATAAALPGGVNNLLAGTGNHASTDAPYGKQKGFIFDAVIDAGLTVRNYGFMVNNIGSIGTIAAPVSDPFMANTPLVAVATPSLVGKTDVYFRGYDQNYPDLWRFNEWKREFDQYVKNGQLPSLETVRISHDHMGNFATALGKVDTPESQQADTDIALGLMVQAVAESRYAKDTLFIITEDDCQDGPDHVDSHRTTTYVVGPYVKKRAVVSTRYGQVNALRTIEDILGTEHMNLNTAYQQPMADVFNIKSSPTWTFKAVASTALLGTTLNLGSTTLAKGPVVVPKHDATYWAKVTEKFNFSEADQVPVALFNKVLWEGLKGDKPYPAIHSEFTVAERD